MTREGERAGTELQIVLTAKERISTDVYCVATKVLERMRNGYLESRQENGE